MKPEGPAKMTGQGKNEELDALIASWWSQNYSSGNIVVLLREKGYYLTRNTVIGKVYRMQAKGILSKKSHMKTLRVLSNTVLELKNEPPKIKPTKKQFIPDRTVKADMIAAKKSRHTELRLINPDTGEGVSIFELTENSCKWVMDFKRDGLPVYCGNEVHARNFCQQHFHICYFMTPRMERDRSKKG